MGLEVVRHSQHSVVVFFLSLVHVVEVDTPRHLVGPGASLDLNGLLEEVLSSPSVDLLLGIGCREWFGMDSLLGQAKPK